MTKLSLILVLLLSLIIILVSSHAFLYHLRDFNNFYRFNFFTYLSMLGIWLFELIKIKNQNSKVLYDPYNF